ncbi:anti-sigma factor [Roseovarius sp. D22-M7]|uniref:anti-sigma factor n=1 Tax=Roseovarius sp. D22-M7 TaxID=3127116 RepID=UPI00300FE505
MSDQDQPDRDDDRVLAGEYTLGLLSADEAAAFEARLNREPELRALYAQWAEDLTGLADDAPAQAPPAHVWRGIEAGLFATEARRPWHLRLLLWGGGVAAAAAAVLVIGFAGLFERAPLPPGDAPYVAELSAEDRDLVVQAVYDDATGRLFVERAAGDAAPGRALELWLIAGEDAPVSLGVLPPDRRAVLRVPDTLRDRFAGSTLAISDEPEGGSPTGAPTGDILAVGQVRDV